MLYYKCSEYTFSVGLAYCYEMIYGLTIYVLLLLFVINMGDEVQWLLQKKEATQEELNKCLTLQWSLNQLMKILRVLSQFE